MAVLAADTTAVALVAVVAVEAAEAEVATAIALEAAAEVDTVLMLEELLVVVAEPEILVVLAAAEAVLVAGPEVPQIEATQPAVAAEGMLEEMEALPERTHLVVDTTTTTLRLLAA